MIERENLWKSKTTKTQTQIKKKPRYKGGNSLNSEIPEWLQEVRENLVEDEIPVHGGSHASSSHEASSEPTFKRREDLGKHSVKTHFPKYRNCEICKRTKITGPHAEDAMAKPFLRAVNFGDLMTADHKVLSDNCESRNNHRYAVVVQDLATQWIQAYPPKEACKSYWIPRGNQKSFELTIPWNSAKLVKISLGIIGPHRSETDATVERGVRRAEKSTSAVLLQSGLTCSWWAYSGMCYLSAKRHKFFLMGRRPMKNDLGNHIKDLLFHLLHWLSITLQLRRISRESINSERKFYLDCSSDTLSTRGEFGRVTYWSKTLRSWKRWSHRKSSRTDLMWKRGYFSNKENLFFQS